MTAPLVTIGIAFYNSQDCLLDSVRSIFAQTFQNWELLLIDDGSTDKSLEIAHTIDDPRVRVISDGTNKKLPARLNQIISLARGKYIARMDADDICWSSRIEKQLDLLEGHPDVDVVGTGIVYLDSFDRPVGHKPALPSHAEICQEPHRGFGMCHGSVVAKKSWYEKYHYDEMVHLGQDFNLWLRSYQESKFANIPDPLYCYRLENSMTLKRQFKVYHKCGKFLFKYHKDAGRWGQALVNLAKQYGKLVATALLFAAGFRKKLMARRFECLSDADMAFYNQEICKIKSTKLPLRSDVQEG